MKDFAEDIPLMLANDIQVLVYSGEYDYIVNWYGGYAWVNDLEWEYRDEWRKASNQTWMVNDTLAGYY